MADQQLRAFPQEQTCAECGAALGSLRVGPAPGAATVVCLVCGQPPGRPAPAPAPGPTASPVAAPPARPAIPKPDPRPWASGGKGERLLGELLDSLDEQGDICVLYGRRIADASEPVDYVVVCPSGVLLVGVVSDGGTVRTGSRRGLSSRGSRITVGRRDCSRAARRLGTQVEAVTAAVGSDRATVSAALCLVDADWRAFGSPLLLDDVWVGWGRALGAMASAPGPLTREQREEIAGRIAARFPNR